MEEQIRAMEKRASEIRSSIVSRLGQVEDKVITTVKGVQTGVMAVKETLSPRKKVTEHPVSMVLGSALAGLITGVIVNKKSAALRELINYRVRASRTLDPKVENSQKKPSNSAVSENVGRHDWRPSA